MCGLCGTMASRATPAPECLRALGHRGPDGAGAFASGGVWLGHTRLAIIDLSDAGAQPMTRPGCGTIVFNGEVYDHEAQRRALQATGIRFDSRSDTEVVLRGLAAKGPSFLRDLHAMYALAWLDAGSRFLWLARDHAGMKPLYLWRHEGRVAFASEIRALTRAIRSLGATAPPRAAALAGFLAWGSVPEPRSVLSGVEMVPADCALAIDVATGEIARRERIATVRAATLERSPVDEVRQGVAHAVSRHLVADTPVALFLSGGVDSGVLAIEAARASPRPTAITVALGSRGTADEEALATQLTRDVGLELRVVQRDDWMRRLDGVLDAFDQPSIDGLNTFLISGVARELGFKVALSGVGADEVFGGYAHLHRRPLPVTHLPGWALVARWAAPALAGSARPGVRRLGAILEGALAGEPQQRSWRRVFPDSVIRKLLPGVTVDAAVVEREAPLQLERDTYLRDTLLRDTDVMGMANGVEIRAPFLDPEVLGVAEGVGAARLLARGASPKWLLRDGWRRELPAGTLSRRKTGFTLDVARWLLGPGSGVIERTRDGLASQRFLDRRAARRLLEVSEGRLRDGHPAAWVPLFAIAQLVEQLRRWGEPT